MGISFTAEQQKVIDTRGCNILVSAAAGSGKTAVLVERIVKMVSDETKPVDIDRLLIVTFTNAAAAEMRERISESVGDKLLGQPENEHLQRQMTLLHNAQITTIDSFCLFVIRNHFHVIGLDPGFRIADEGEMKLLMADVLSDVLEQSYQKGEASFLHCMEYFSTGNSDKAVEEAVFKLYDFAMSYPFPEEWLMARKSDYALAGEDKVSALAELGWMQELMEDTSLLLQGMLDRMSQCIAICEEADGPYMYAELLEQEKERLEKLIAAQTYEERRLFFDALVFGRLSSKKDETVSVNKRELVKNIRAEVKEQLQLMQKNYFAQPSEETSRQMETCGEAVSALADLALLFKREFDSAKRKKNLIDFDDMEHFALSILLERKDDGNVVPTETALEYRSYFEEILIDEYQDSNLVQEYLLSAISGEDEGKFNRFMVGDVKQSIYKFRLARPELFMEKYDAYGWDGLELISVSPDGGHNGTDCKDAKDMEYIIGCKDGSNTANNAIRIDLHKNFRSRKEVLTSVNAVFSQVMIKKLGGIEYDENAALYPGAAYTELGASAKAHDASGMHSAEAADALENGNETDRTDNDANRKDDINRINDTNRMDNETCRTANDTELLIFIEKDDETPDLDIWGAEATAKNAKAAEAGTNSAAPNAKQQEAYGIAGKIKELVTSFQVTDRESGMLRKASFGDIVILLRTASGWDEEFKQVLEKEDIPVHITSKTGYFKTAEIQELLHLLRVLDNPLQDIPFYGLLHSYFGGFTEEEIAAVRAAFPRKRYLYDAVCAYAGGDMIHGYATESGQTESGQPKSGTTESEQQELGITESVCPELGATESRQPESEQDLIDPELQYKLRDFLEELEKYREMTIYMPVYELLQTIIREYSYLDYVAVKPGGSRRRGNVEMLLVKAADYEKTSYYGLYHFLRYIEQLEKYDVDYGEANLQDENADVVRIMSIHKSKGLEFPICIVAGLSKSFNNRDANDSLVMDVELGIGADYVNPELRIRSRSLRRNFIASKLKKDNLAEELRILYVAMTRAKEKLILTGLLKKPEKKKAALLMAQGYGKKSFSYDMLMQMGSFLDILLSAAARNKCFDNVWKLYDIVPDAANPLYGEEMNMDVSVLHWEDTFGLSVKETVRREDNRRRLLLSDAEKEVDKTLMTVMSEKFSYQYPYDNLKNLYTKTTVSELKKAGTHEEMDFSFPLYEEEKIVPYLPKFIKADSSVSGTDRGSAYHKVMELLDFSILTNAVSRMGAGMGGVNPKESAEAGIEHMHGKSAEPDTEHTLGKSLQLDVEHTLEESAHPGIEHMLEELVRSDMDRMLAEGKLPQAYYDVVYIPKIAAFLQSGIAKRMAKAAAAGKLYREQPFVLGLPANRLSESFPAGETVLIQGIIDVFFEEDGKYVVVDYKTDAVKAPGELIERYRAQLDYYAEALEQILGGGKGKPGAMQDGVEKIIYSFGLGKEIGVG